MDKIRCIIVDDDKTSIKLLEKYIERLDEFSIISSFTNPINGIKFIQDNPIDLIFLDVEMPQLSGINFIKILSHKKNIILTTASRQYAFDAFELDIIDYLLKPFNYERFLKAIDKFKELNNFKKEGKEKQTKRGSAIFVKENYKTKKILIDDILYIESDKEYVKIFTLNSVIRTKQSLSYYDNNKSLPFLRIHRSFIININHINSFSFSEVQVGSKFLPIGRSFKNLVKEKLG